MDPAKKAELNHAFKLKLFEVLIDKGALALILAAAIFVGNFILASYNALITKKLDDHRKELTDDSTTRLASFQSQLTKELDKNRDELNRESGKHLEAFKSQLTLSLEDYRHRLAMQQYFAQRRFEAIDGVITSYNRLFALFVDNTREKEITKKHKEDYRSAIIAVFAAHSNKELVIPRTFSTQLEKLGFMHRGLLINGFSDEKYMKLFVDLGDQLSQMGRDAIDPPDPGKQMKYFELQDLPPPPERRKNEVAAKYLDAELARWEQWKNAKVP
jgi:hypothetical protein